MSHDALDGGTVCACCVPLRLSTLFRLVVNFVLAANVDPQFLQSKCSVSLQCLLFRYKCITLIEKFFFLKMEGSNYCFAHFQPIHFIECIFIMTARCEAY